MDLLVQRGLPWKAPGAPAPAGSGGNAATSSTASSGKEDANQAKQ
jgi:hypothetical protein